MLRQTVAVCFPRTGTLRPHSPPTRAALRASNHNHNPNLNPLSDTDSAAATAATTATTTAPTATSKRIKPTNPRRSKFSTPFPENSPKFHLSSSQTAIPLPTTFASKDLTPKAFAAVFKPPKSGFAPAVSPAPLSPDEHVYPYRFYEVTLRRGLIGIDKHTLKCVHALGLHGRHQVVWRAVNPNNAGLILKIRELVTVRLVNELPAVVERGHGERRPDGSLMRMRGAVPGYTKIGSAIPSNILSPN